MESNVLKRAALASTFVIMLLVAMFTCATFLPYAWAANGVEITSILPSTRIGKVGDTVIIIGTINQTDGEYRLWFGSYNVTPAESRATGNQVNATFQVPIFPSGNYTITLVDVAKDINATAPFRIEPAYYIKAIAPPLPQQLQENGTVSFLVNVTGGQPNTVYYANVSVMLPSPLRTNYSAVVALTNTTSTGSGYASITYPNQTLFHPLGSSTDYTGSYQVYFNRTQSLAGDKFSIGMTDKTQYHREDVVQIRAVHYGPNQTVTVNVTFPKTTKTGSFSVNASQEGIISTTWIVPFNASIGAYNVTMYSTPAKQIRDSQLFSIIGYQIDVYTRNKAGDAVPQILVEALDEANQTKTNVTSNENGFARFQLEKGNHTFEAFWKAAVRVGELPNATVAGNGTIDLPCALTNMKITVIDQDENVIPFVALSINYTYVTTKEGKKQNGTATGQTDISGVFFMNSTLTRIDYTINASRYGIVFNGNNNTVIDLPVEVWYNTTILCPPETLTLNVTENHHNPLLSAHVELVEQMGGISYSGTASGAGTVVVNATFGKYIVRVYVNSILLKETPVDLFNDTYQEIYCQLYNITMSVKVVDYFGQPIPNANVTCQLGDLQNSALTEPDGSAIFNDIIGGDLQVTVNLPGQSHSPIITTWFVDNSETIEIKIDEYVMLAGFLVETSYLTTAIIIAVTVILALSIEVYRRRRSKQKKSSE
jgi:hypothetical protein